jgi:hypothetical protein
VNHAGCDNLILNRRFDMADAPGNTSNPPPYEDSGTAPFVYFDIIPAQGVMNGAIQIELASRILVPGAGTSVTVKFVASGRIRCSPAAAIQLRNAIDESLKMLEQDQPSPSATSKLN